MRRWAPAAVLLATLAAGCSSSADRTAASSPAAVAPESTAAMTTPAPPAAASSRATPHPSAAGSSRPAANPPVTTPPPPVPPLSAAARAAGLVDIRTVVPDAIVDLRYATSHNFVGVRLYPTDARCLVHESMAPGLVTAARQLRRAGFVLVFWDCYRPHAVQVRMFEDVPNPAWVARPGRYARSHEAARSVDVTLARATAGGPCPASRLVQGHCRLDMGTGFDDFSPRAYAFATDGVSAQAQADRARLRAAMITGGIVVYSGEWWHFDGPGSGVDRPQLTAPLR